MFESVFHFNGLNSIHFIQKFSSKQTHWRKTKFPKNALIRSWMHVFFNSKLSFEVIRMQKESLWTAFEICWAWMKLIQMNAIARNTTFPCLFGLFSASRNYMLSTFSNARCRIFSSFGDRWCHIYCSANNIRSGILSAVNNGSGCCLGSIPNAVNDFRWFIGDCVKCFSTLIIGTVGQFAGRINGGIDCTFAAFNNRFGGLMCLISDACSKILCSYIWVILTFHFLKLLHGQSFKEHFILIIWNSHFILILFSHFYTKNL